MSPSLLSCQGNSSPFLELCHGQPLPPVSADVLPSPGGGNRECLQLGKPGSERSSDLKSHRRQACVPGCSVDDLLEVPPHPAMDGKNVEPGGECPKFVSGPQHLLTCSGQFPWADPSRPLVLGPVNLQVWCLPGRACRVIPRSEEVSRTTGTLSIMSNMPAQHRLPAITVSLCSVPFLR